MAHIISKDLGNGYVMLTAEEGYQLYSVRLNRAVSEAVVTPSDCKFFTAIKL